MADLKMLKRCATALAMGLMTAVSGPVSGQVQTNVPDVVPGAKPATVEHIKYPWESARGQLEGDNGSMYSSSVTTGDFETFIARDVVSYMALTPRRCGGSTARKSLASITIGRR
jgi:hypothetical protein